VTVALLRHVGLPLTEPLAFGVGSGIFFGHLPWFKVAGIPLTTFRAFPGSIFAKVCRRLGVSYARRRWLSAKRGMAFLDRMLTNGHPVGLQANIFWLDYFPRAFRSQFNGHNLIAVDRTPTGYTLSDPLLEAPVSCDVENLRRARFARGPLAPRGLLYYPLVVRESPNRAKAVWAGIRETSSRMLRVPVPIFGVRGIRFLAREVARWPARLKNGDTARAWLGNVVRMQEEVGTGGAGFRFMYAAFLQEASELTQSDRLARCAEMMTCAGDRWRDFAVEVARICRNSSGSAADYARAGQVLLECAELEEQLFRSLDEATRRT
jgi:hypothetical protein